MAKTKATRQPDSFSKKEAAERMNAALRAALGTPPALHTSATKRKKITAAKGKKK